MSTSVSQNTLIAFQGAVTQKKYNKAIEQVHILLSDFMNLSQAKEVSESFYLTLVSSISDLFSDKKFIITDEQFQLLGAHHASIAMSFTLAGFQNADHVFIHIADVSDIENISFPDQNAALKCLLLYNLNSDFNLDLHGFSLKYPEIVAPILLGLLSTRCLINEKTEARFNELLEIDWSHLSNYKPSLSNMVSMSNAWMFCSYGHVAKKHQVKFTLNQIIRNWCQQALSESTDTKAAHLDFYFNINNSNNKKVILIPIEAMTHRHAMFRCFSRILKNLSESFHTVALSPKHSLDDVSKTYFSEVIYFEPIHAFQHSVDFITQLKSLDVDAVYYPSLGMANSILLLANHRIADIQFYTLGHPATSHIECMDYVLVQEQDLCQDLSKVNNIFSEKIILIDNETSSTIGDVARAPRKVRGDNVINVAITSTHMKINYTFFKTCQRIAELSKEQNNKELCFYIFPGANGPTLHYLEQEFKKLLVNCKVFPNMDYESYMVALSECQMRLGTFPFGGANSNMDCFALGIPFIALAGNEVHAQSDVGQLEQAGLDFLVAEDIEDYVQLSLKLIEDAEFYQSVCEKMGGLAEHPFFNGKINDESDFSQTIHRLLEQQAIIKNSDQQVWDLRA